MAWAAREHTHMMRSMLFVPADSDRKLSRAATAGADALILDLEDSVLPERKALARGLMKEFVGGATDRSRLWVRVNDLASGELIEDLAAVVAAQPVGIVLPKIHGPEDLATVSGRLDALQAANGDAPDTLLITVLAETPSAVLRLSELVRQPQSRVAAVMWGAEDLSSALGAGGLRSPDGHWRPVYEYARTQSLLTAHALGAEAIDTVYVDFYDWEGLRESCDASRYDGFTGRAAIHPDQVPIINEAFSPSESELTHARRVVAAFESGAGAVSIDRKMYDIAHLKAARRLLDLSRGRT